MVTDRIGDSNLRDKRRRHVNGSESPPPVGGSFPSISIHHQRGSDIRCRFTARLLHPCGSGRAACHLHHVARSTSSLTLCTAPSDAQAHAHAKRSVIAASRDEVAPTIQLQLSRRSGFSSIRSNKGTSVRGGRLSLAVNHFSPPTFARCPCALEDFH